MAQPTQERLASQLEKPQQTSGNVGQAGSGTQPENSPHFQDHEDDHTHHVQMPTYYAVFALLIFLLFITVGAWYFDQHVRSLGHFSTPIAMAIAVAKAAAIVMIFMHVKFSSKLVQVFSCTGIAFVSIMFLLTFNDYGTRPWLPNAGVYTIQSSQNSMGNNGDNNQNNDEIVRASSVGASPNSQSTPADNMVGSAMSAPGNATQTAIDGARERGSSVRGMVNGGALPPQPGSGTRGATSMSGALNDPNSVLNNGGSSATSATSSDSGRTGDQVSLGHNQAGAAGAAGMNANRQDLATNGSSSNPGPIIGGAANNVYGSAPQSQGIEPKRVAPAPPVPNSLQAPATATGASAAGSAAAR